MLDGGSFGAGVPVEEGHDAVILFAFNTGAHTDHTVRAVVTVSVSIVEHIANGDEAESGAGLLAVNAVPETNLPAVPEHIHTAGGHLGAGIVPVLGAGVRIHQTQLIRLVQELGDLVVGILALIQLGEGVVGLQHGAALQLLAVPGGQLHDVGGTDHVVVAVPVGPQGEGISGIAVFILGMHFMDLHQGGQQVVQGLELRSADLFVQIPAEHRAGVDHFVSQGAGGSIGHFAGDAVVLSFFTGQTLVVHIDLGLELHDVFAVHDLVTDILGQAGINDFRELGLVDDDHVAEVAFLRAGGIDRVANHLGSDDVQFNVELVLNHFGEPARLDAVVVSCIIVEVDGQEFGLLSHRADGHQAQKHGKRQQNRQKPFHK